MTKVALALAVASLLLCCVLGEQPPKHSARRHGIPTRGLHNEPSSLRQLRNERIRPRAGEFPCPDAEAIAPCECYYYELVSLYCSNVTQEELENAIQQEFPVKELYSLNIDYSTVTSLDFDLNGLSFTSLFVYESPITMISAEFLTSLSSTLESIDLDYTQITTEGFPFASLENMEVLTYLSFDGANIEYLPNIIAPRLVELLIWRTPLRSISPGTFDGAPLLVDLELLETDVSVLEAGTFPVRDLTGQFYIDELESIVPGVFYSDSDSPSVVSYILEVGNLTELLPESILIGRTTQYISFLSNQIETIDADAFHIYLPPDSNSITMDLRNNKLTEVDEEVFGPLMPLLRLLELEGNPLACGCDIAWIVVNEEILSKISVVSTCADGRYVRELDPEYYADQC